MPRSPGVALKCKKRGFTPGFSGCQGYGCPSPSPISFQINKLAGAISALQLARLLGCPSSSRLPTYWLAGEEPTARPSPGTALGTVPSCLPWSKKAVTLKLSPPSTRARRPALRPVTVDCVIHSEAIRLASESGFCKNQWLIFRALLGVDQNLICALAERLFYCCVPADSQLSLLDAVLGPAGHLVAVFKLITQPFDSTSASAWGAAL